MVPLRKLPVSGRFFGLAKAIASRPLQDTKRQAQHFQKADLKDSAGAKNREYSKKNVLRSVQWGFLDNS
jgi:hypothetical protein